MKHSLSLNQPHESDGDLHTRNNRPLMELLREGDKHSSHSESPRLVHVSLNDSPRALGKPGANHVKHKHSHMNGILADDKKYRSLTFTGSGQDIVERTALISHQDIDIEDKDPEQDTYLKRHLSVGNNNFMNLTAERPRSSNLDMISSNRYGSQDYNMYIPVDDNHCEDSVV